MYGKSGGIGRDSDSPSRVLSSPFSLSLSLSHTHCSLPGPRSQVIALGEVQRDLASAHAHAHAQSDEAAGAPGAALSEDELDLLRGALSLSEKQVEGVMRPISQVFSLAPDAILDQATMAKIAAKGFSRVPLRMARGTGTIAKCALGSYSCSCFRSHASNVHAMTHDVMHDAHAHL